MKKSISLALGIVIALGLSVVSYAESSPIISENGSSYALSAAMPRMAYEDGVRTIKSRGSWTSSKYYCVPGDYFGGGVDDYVTLTGKIQFSTTTDGPWKTLSTKTLSRSSMSVEVTQKGYYRFVLTNNSSSSISAECYVMID